MSSETHAVPAPLAQVNPAVAYLATERAILCNLPLRPLTPLEQMYAYFGSDRA